MAKNLYLAATFWWFCDAWSHMKFKNRISPPVCSGQKIKRVITKPSGNEIPTRGSTGDIGYLLLSPHGLRIPVIWWEQLRNMLDDVIVIFGQSRVTTGNTGQHWTHVSYGICERFHDNSRCLYAVKFRHHTPWSRVRCHGCRFTYSQFHSQCHSRRHSLRISNSEIYNIGVHAQ